MNTYVEIIGQGTASIFAEQDGSSIYEPVVTSFSISSPQIINVATGNLTITSGFEALDYSYIPSGYTNSAFIPLINDSNPGFGQAFRRSWLNKDGTETSSPKPPGPNEATGTKAYFEFNNLNSGSFSRHMMTQTFQLFTGNTFPLTAATNFIANNSGQHNIVPWSWVPIRPQFMQGRVKIYDIDERLDHVEESGVFSLLPDQKIGVGTYTPSQKLDIEGNIQIDGGYINPIQDNNILNITGYIV